MKIVNFSACVTLKLDGWPWKTIGHLFYITSSFGHHFKSISESKLELQSRNAQFGSKSVIFVPCDLEIWWMTLKNNRTPLLYHLKLCASFQSHWWIQTGVTIRKRPIRVKIRDFLSPVTLREREREIKFIGLFENRGHRGPYSPYKPFNHNLYIGIIIFPHIDNPQYTGYDLPKKKPNKIINEKKWGPH